MSRGGRGDVAQGVALATQLPSLRWESVTQAQSVSLVSVIAPLKQLRQLAWIQDYFPIPRRTPTAIGGFQQLLSHDLTQLTYLRLGGFSTSAASQLASEPKQLQHLHFEGYHRMLQGDEWLVSAGNNLTDLPEDFSELRQIRMLRIKYNQLSRLPAAVVKLPQLVTLELSGNQIVKLDSSIAKVGWCWQQVSSACRQQDCV